MHCTFAMTCKQFKPKKYKLLHINSQLRRMNTAQHRHGVFGPTKGPFKRPGINDKNWTTASCHELKKKVQVGPCTEPTSDSLWPSVHLYARPGRIPSSILHSRAALNGRNWWGSPYLYESIKFEHCKFISINQRKQVHQLFYSSRKKQWQGIKWASHGQS